MRRAGIWCLLACVFCAGLKAEVRLPGTLRMAGPLDPAKSQFGDEFFNFPFGRGEGSPPLRGWIAFQFNPPVDKISRFTITFQAVGEDHPFSFPDGHFFNPKAFGAYQSGVQVSRGKLNVETGETEEIEIHAVFHNSVIHKSARNNRFPFSSSRRVGRLSPLNSDYPPIDLPITLPFEERPRTFARAKFIVDAAGQISGFDFGGEGFTPVTVLPRVGLFPIYSFGDRGQFYFPAADGCLPGTVPPERCFTEKAFPDGAPLPVNAFLHPNFALVTDQLREVPAQRMLPSCMPAVAAASAVAVSSDGRLYHIGGFTGNQVTGQVQIYEAQNRRWTQGPVLAVPVMSARATTVGGTIYVIGGTTTPGGAPVGLVQALDTRLNQWRLLAQLPAPVYEAVVASDSRRIFVFGGHSTTSSGQLTVSDKLQIYDIASDAWTEGARMPAGAAGSSIAVVGSEIYVINGALADGTVTRRVQIFNTSSEQWREGKETDRGIYQGTAVHLDGRIYLAGGRLSVGGPVDSGDVFFNQQRMQVLELKLNDWILGLEAPLPTAESSVAVVGGEMYILGGRAGVYEAPGAVTDVVQAYSPALGWEVCDSHPIFSGDTVVNAASLGVGARELSPGSRASMLGHHFASEPKSAPLIRVENGFLTTDLPPEVNGISIKVDGKPAPILSVGPTRVDFQIPFDIQSTSVARSAVVEVVKRGAESQAPPVNVPLVSAAPGIFIYSHDESRAVNYLTGAAAVAYNQDGRLHYASQPVRPDEALTLYASGLGPAKVVPEAGQRAGEFPPSSPLFGATITIDGKPAQLISARLASHHVGVYELKVQVPRDTSKGNRIPVQITVDDVASNIATITVK